MFEVLNYIKDNDVSIRPKLVPNYPTFIPQIGGGILNHSRDGPMGSGDIGE